MQRLLRLIIMLLLFSPSVVFSFGGDETGTSAAVILSQPSSARLLALGGAGTAASQGAQALGWNPANLTLVKVVNAEFSFRRHFQDTELGFINLAWPTPWGVPAVGITYAQTQNIACYDSFGNELDPFSTRELDLQLAWAMTFGKLHLGLAGHYLLEDLNTITISGWGVDMGATYNLLPWLNTSLALLRMGKTELGDPLSFEIRPGLSATPLPDLTCSMDVVIPWDDDPYIAAGAEWVLFDFLAFRAGWRTGPAELSGWNDLTWLTLGVGFKWNDFYLDYLFEPGGFVEDVHQLSLGYRYNPTPKKASPEVIQNVSTQHDSQPESWSPKPLPTDNQTAETQSHLRFLPRPLGSDYNVKEIEFTITTQDGRVIKKFRYVGSKAIPKEFSWDCTDENGRPVSPENSTYQFRYITNKGQVVHQQQWPTIHIGPKLQFEKGGHGVEPEVIFTNQENLDKIKNWTISIYQSGATEPVQTTTANGPLPSQFIWDGKKSDETWADPGKTYLAMIYLTNKQSDQITFQKNIPAVSAKMIEKSDNGIKFKITEIEFAFRQTKITDTMMYKIDKTIEICKKNINKISVKIEGHSDQIGSNRINDNISRRRALEVRHYLFKHGIPATGTLDYQGYGKKKLLFKSQSEESRNKNRRVEIVIETGK